MSLDGTLEHDVGAGAPSPPRSPVEARENIERTRERISDTLDQIEHRIASKKREIKDTVSLRSLRMQVKSRPWRAVAVAVGAGLLLAVLRRRKREEPD